MSRCNYCYRGLLVRINRPEKNHAPKVAVRVLTVNFLQLRCFPVNGLFGPVPGRDIQSWILVTGNLLAVSSRGTFAWHYLTSGES